MEWNFLFFFNSILLGFGLAMDAFSVSLANGLTEPQMKNSRMTLISGVYAVFQFLMPMAGWVLVTRAASYFSKVQKLIPWISLALLSYIGGKMLLEGIQRIRKPQESEEEVKSTIVLGFGTLLIQGIATSIDALSVGFTIADYSAVMALAATMLIGAVTWIICYVGLAIGKRFGTKLSRYAMEAGGVILIGIGIEIFVSHMIG